MPQDIRYALRQMRRNPGFTTAAVAILAIGIGANTAIFSLIDTVLLRPLPYHQPGQLVLLTESLPKMGMEEVGVSAGEYEDYRVQNRSFSQVAAFEGTFNGKSMNSFNLTGAGSPLHVNAAKLSASAFPLLGISPELGRAFTEEEDRFGAGKVVVISHELWMTAYNRDPGILGQTIKLDEELYTVIGVMPASFRFPFDEAPLSERADVWVPEAFDPARFAPDRRTEEFGIGVLGRLKPGVTAQAAEADAAGIARNFMVRGGYGGAILVDPHVYAFAPHLTEKARPLLLLLTLAVGCVLLVACANVANMLLARAAQRYPEMAIRSAIGAGRVRILRQSLLESALLSAFGASAGILFAWLVLISLVRFGPADVPRLHQVRLHPIALLFTLVVSLLCAFGFGVMPAWRLSRVAPISGLRESRQAGRGRSMQKLQHSMAIVEIAAALVLLACGGLLIKSFVRVLQAPLGFNPNGAYVVRTMFDRRRYPEPGGRIAVQKQLLDSLRQLPGVTAVAAASHLPLSDSRQIGFLLERDEPGDFHWAENSLTTPGYFHVLGITQLSGRDFDEHDTPDSPNVAIVNQAFARQFLPGQNAIGRRVNWGGRTLFTIIGVVGDVHISALDADPPPMIYNSMFQTQSGASGRMAFVFRSNSASEGLLEAVQRRVWSVDKELPVYQFSSLNALIAESVAQRRFTVMLLAAFGGIGLLLAAIGLFAVISYLVAERTREFGIRMALGADHGRIYRHVLKRAAGMALGGCGIGTLLSLFASRALQSSLYRVSRFDASILVFVPLLLLAVALAAAYWPAHRAANVDPMQALRYE